MKIIYGHHLHTCTIKNYLYSFLWARLSSAVSGSGASMPTLHSKNPVNNSVWISRLYEGENMDLGM